MPDIREEEKTKGQAVALLKQAVAETVRAAIGGGLACIIYFAGSKDTYDDKITQAV